MYIAECHMLMDHSIRCYRVLVSLMMNGIWKPIKAIYSFIWYIMDYYLDFDSSSNLGNDANGDSTDFTLKI